MNSKAPPTDAYWHMPPNQPKALMLAKRQLSELVCDAVNLEGINLTLPEVQTLLEGITVGGHKISDQQITLNQAAAWRLIFSLIEEQRFVVSQEMAFSIHAVAAKEEALEWETHTLPEHFATMLDDMEKLPDVYDQAIHLFLTMARCQFFYDVNKRMGRFMMNAYLLDHGYPAINLPAKQQKAFNENMLRFYVSNDQAEMNAFMRGCMDERVVGIMVE